MPVRVQKSSVENSGDHGAQCLRPTTPALTPASSVREHSGVIRTQLRQPRNHSRFGVGRRLTLHANITSTAAAGHVAVTEDEAAVLKLASGTYCAAPPAAGKHNGQQGSRQRQTDKEAMLLNLDLLKWPDYQQ